MTTEIAVNEKTGEIVPTGSFTPEQTQLLKRVVGKDFSDDEFLVFLNVCKKVQLDPFSKQIYAIKFQGRMTVMTGIDGLRLVADRSGCYSPGRAPTFTYDKEGKLESATAYVKKLVQNQWHEVAATAFYNEYHNTYNQLWNKLPHALLEKCAEAKALRRAFPNETSGLYAREEMEQAETNAKPSVSMPKAKTVEAPKEPEIVEKKAEEMREDVVVEEAPIEFGDPPEVENVKKKFGGKVRKPITEKQRGMLFAKCKSANIPENVFRAFIKDNFGTEHTSELYMDEMDKCIEWIDKYEAVSKA